jgi:hypothetical protein
MFFGGNKKQEANAVADGVGALFGGRKTRRSRK